MAKIVEEVMSKDLRCCSITATVPDVAHIMTAYDVSSVVVLDEDGYLAGIVTRTDLVALRGSEEYWHGLTAGHVMKTDVVTCLPATPMRDASKMLVQKSIHRLVVVENTDSSNRVRPVGVLSQTDIVRDMALSS